MRILHKNEFTQKVSLTFPKILCYNQIKRRVIVSAFPVLTGTGVSLYPKTEKAVDLHNFGG